MNQGQSVKNNHYHIYNYFFDWAASTYLQNMIYIQSNPYRKIKDFRVLFSRNVFSIYTRISFHLIRSQSLGEVIGIFRRMNPYNKKQNENFRYPCVNEIYQNKRSRRKQNFIPSKQICNIMHFWWCELEPKNFENSIIQKNL